MIECETVRVTFEDRHENKSCSACRELVNESVPGSQLLSDIQTIFGANREIFITFYPNF